MQQTSLPSKQFLIRGGIAIGIVSLILIFQTDWFWGLFGKKAPRIDPNQTIGQTIAKDSNGNGIPDWEERLFGLDPTELYTGDMSNKEIIENKKKALGLNADGDEGPLNESDRIARQLFSIGVSLGQEGASLNDIGAAGSALAESYEFKQITNRYQYADLKKVNTNKQNLQTYQAKIASVLETYDTSGADFTTFATAVDQGDLSGINLTELKNTAANYKRAAETLAATPVPIGAALYHLNIINGLYGISESFTLLADTESNPLTALNGLAIYREYSLTLETAVLDLSFFLTDYGIL